MRALLVVSLPLLLLGACGSTPKDRRLDYATVQTLNPGVDGRWVLEEFPQAGGVQRDANGKIRRLSYGVTDPAQKSQTLDLLFDEHEVLVKKEYSGRLIRPTLPNLGAPHEVNRLPGTSVSTRGR